ncbi:MAG: universal stress protein UspA [Burkholderiales bacterium]|jgi:nucleotide-binding universal stress UspA family protein|nr:universal stress protein UspA [Burkholderiales bacterium]
MTLKLLLAFDGSTSANRAAELLAGHAGADDKIEVLVLGVDPRTAAAGSAAVEPAAARLAESGIAVRRQVRVGPAAPAILAEARRQKPAAIVMGTRGEGALHGFALGSVALRVVHRARLPVFLVKAQDRLPAAFGRRLRVLLATDGSKPAMRAAQRLVAWRPWLGELEVHLLWVQPPLSYLQTVLPPHDDVIEQWNTKEGGRATRAAVVLFRSERIPTHVHLSVGDAALEVRSLAEETKAELVALGTRGLGAAHHALVGSVALKAAVACPVPVLLVP